MAKYYESDKQNPIVTQLRINHLLKADLCRELKISLSTLNRYINRPQMMSLETITVMSGMFGLCELEMVYLIRRNKPQMNDAGKWYIEEIRQKHLGSDNI